jgi:hypothetical protein
VRCIESTPGRQRLGRATAIVSAVTAMAACSLSSPDRGPGEGGSAARTSRSAVVAAPPPAGDSRSALPPPRNARSWAEVREQAAERMVAANPDLTYVGSVPDPLLAIPVLEIELNGDGSIRRIEVLREPRQAKDTLRIAIDAVRRAAPFGDVTRLPRPWKFVETFLFDDSRRFKPRTLER